MSDDYLSAVDEVLAAGGNPNGAEDTSPPEPSDLDTLRPVADPYDTAVGGIIAENETRLRASVLAAQEQNPDIAAQVKRAADSVGDPVGAAMRLPKEYLDHYKVQDTLTRLMNTPVTRDWLTNPASSAIAHDDIAPLTDIERRMQEFGSIENATRPEGTLLNALDAALLGARQSVDFLGAQAGVMRGAFRGMLRDKLGLAGDDFDIYGNPTTPDANLNLDRARLRQLDFEASLAQPEFDESTITGKIKSAATSGLVSAGRQAPAIAGAAAVQGVAGLLIGLGGAATGSGGDQAAKILDRGGSNTEAFLGGLGSGGVEAATELIPMSKLLGAFGSKGAKDFMESALASVLTDVPGEQLATLAQDAIDTAVANPNMTWGEYWKDRPGAAFDTLVATLAQGTATVGAGVAGRAAVDKLNGADKAVSTAESLKKVMDTASTSKLKERDPDAFAALVQQSADKTKAPDVYVEAEAFAQAIEAAGDEGRAILAKMPTATAQLVDAAMTGADVRLPMGELVAAVSGTPLQDALLQHVRATPDALSAAQAQEMADTNFEELRGEAATILETSAQASELQASADLVYQRVSADLASVNRFTPEVNAGYATLTRDFFTVLANRLGITPEEAFNRYPLRTVGTPVVGEGLDQESGAFGPVLRDFTGDAKGAVEKLKEMKTGEAIGALNHPAVGDIDLVWGKEGKGASDGYGLAKLLKHHPEVVDDLQGVLDGMVEVSRTDNRVQLESADHRAGVRLEWDGEAKNWLLTAFEKEKAREFTRQETEGGGPSGSAQDATTDTALPKAGDDTARPGNAPEVNITQDPLDLKTLRQSARGTFTPSSNTIALLKDADLSTYLHELGHFFLETYAHLAAQPNAPAQIADDMDALLKWFKVKDIETWRGMTLEEQRANHEKFARGFEAYLFSGEAPNAEIQGLFQRFRSWLVAVYKSVANLKVDLTAEVRGVMDRMIATDAQIAQAEALQRYRPMFESAEQMGVSEEEFAVYQSLGAEATTKATEQLDKRSLRDMKWAADAKAKALRDLQKDTRSKRAEVMAEVRAEVLRMPVYAAQRFMSHGELPEAERNQDQRRIAQQAGQEGNKLDLGVLKEMYGEEANALWRYLPVGKYGYAANQGIHPDALAELFGFTSGDELVRKVLEAEPQASVIEGMTDQRMLERYGDISSPEALERAAEAAIHNEVRGRFVAAELKALNAANNAKESTGTDRKGRSTSVNLIVRAAKQFAAQLVAAKKIRELRPALFAQAEAKNARIAEQMLIKKDLAGAAAAKRQQMLAHYSTREATTAQAEVQRGLDYLRKFAKDSVRKNVDPDYIDQIDAILERYDLRRATTAKQVARRQSLAEWVQAQEDMGFSPPIDPALLADARLVSYKDLTVEQFKGLVESVKVIDHLGRLKRKLLTAKDQRDYEAIRDQIIESLEENAVGDPAELRTRNTLGSRGLRLFKGFLAMHRKGASILYEMDGLKDGGPLWTYLTSTMNDAGEAETSMREKATIELMRIMAPLLKGGKLGGKGKHFSSVGVSLNREEIFSIALNVGNEGNLQRLLDGGIGDSGAIQPAQLQPILDTLTAEEWQSIQAIWDYFETFKPQIAAKERRVNGVEPEWIEAMPVVTAFGTLRGGYYPIKYDPQASQKAQQFADADAARAQMQSAFTSATTRRSFTKARAERVMGRPILLNFGAVYQGINEVIHDLAWHEWLIDANRLLRDPGIDRAMRRGYGPEKKTQLTRMVEAAARGDTPAQNEFEMAINHLRVGTTVAGLGWNLMTSLTQPLGLTQSMVRVGPGWVAKGLAQWTAAPVETVREIYAKSEFMRLRGKTMNREINEVQNRISGGKGKVKTVLDASFFLLIQKGQMIADIPTWLGAYEKALAEGETEDRAVSRADQAVIDSQGDGQVQNLSGVQRGSPLQKLFTNFYSYFATTYNLSVERTRAATRRPTPSSMGRLAVDYLMLYGLPVVLLHALKSVLLGDDDEPEEIAKKLANEQLSYMLGTMVGMREIGSAALGAFGYSGPAGTRFFSTVGNLVKQVWQGDADDALLKAVNDTGGILLHYPSGQINRSVKGAAALLDGKTVNPLSLLLGPPQN